LFSPLNWELSGFRSVFDTRNCTLKTTFDEEGFGRLPEDPSVEAGWIFTVFSILTEPTPFESILLLPSAGRCAINCSFGLLLLTTGSEGSGLASVSFTISGFSGNSSFEVVRGVFSTNLL